MDGLSTKEVAEITGRAEVTVKVCLHRAKNRLRERLAERGIDPYQAFELE